MDTAHYRDRPRKTVLVVDDDTDLRSLVFDNVLDIDSDAVVVQSADGADALLRAARQRFDLVITDIKMPRKDGYALLEALNRLPRAQQPGHVLVFSAHIDPKSAPAQRSQGSLSWLPKPCSAEALQGEIERALPRKPRAAPEEKTAQRSLVNLVTILANSTVGVLSELGLGSIQQEAPFVLPAGGRLGGRVACAQLAEGSFNGEMGISLENALIARILGAPAPAVDSSTPSGLVKEITSRILALSKPLLEKQGVRIESEATLSDESAFEAGPRVVIPFSTPSGTAWLLPAIRMAA
jgi:two-component system chemotaxis response regulator CheY